VRGRLVQVDRPGHHVFLHRPRTGPTCVATLAGEGSAAFGRKVERRTIAMTATTFAMIARLDFEHDGLHECWHTLASLLIAAGVHAKAITALPRHASIQTTFDLYGHLMPGNEDEAVALVDTYVERARTQDRIAQL
jgi:hypothetical protein